MVFVEILTALGIGGSVGGAIELGAIGFVVYELVGAVKNYTSSKK